jgi:sporulation protein YlmC with PRC-barrel domain
MRAQVSLIFQVPAISGVDRMLASELNGLKVFAAGMKMVGNVVDEVIDPQAYTLTDLELKLEKSAARMIFGEKFTFGSPKIRVPVSAIDKIGDAVILKFTIDQLKEHVQKT